MGSEVFSGKSIVSILDTGNVDEDIIESLTDSEGVEVTGFNIRVVTKCENSDCDEKFGRPVLILGSAEDVSGSSYLCSVCA